MPTHFHAIVWIDHSQAKVFHIGLSGEDEVIVHPHMPTKHLHHKANSIGSGHATADKDFLHAVIHAVADAGAVLIAGPGNAKAELVKHIHEHDPKLMKLIAGVETVDHPSDAQLVAYARHYLGAADKMTPQKT